MNPAGNLPGNLPGDLADHPTAPSRGRADRRRDGLLEAGIDPGRRPPLAARLPPAARSAPADRPLPVHPAPLTRVAPVPAPAGDVPLPARAAARPPWTPALVPVPTPAPAPVPVAVPVGPSRSQPFLGPATTVAPFQAVPAPAPEHPSAPLPDLARALAEPAPPAPAVPPAAVPPPPVPPAVAPTPARPTPATPPPAARTPAPPPVPRAAPVVVPTMQVPVAPVARVAAPLTTAIPEREIVRGRLAADPHHDADPPEYPAPEYPAPEYAEPEYAEPEYAEPEYAEPAYAEPEYHLDAAGPDSGSHPAVVGGRAADRAARRAAEDERRRVARANGIHVPRNATEVLENDDDRAASRGRRLGALVAVVVVALLVLGVYSFASPATQEAADVQEQPAATTSAPVVVPSGALPPLNVDPLPPTDDAPATPMRVPVYVLNATDVNGLAGDIAGVLDGEGWTKAGTASYDGTDIAVTTVYYTAGDDEQRQSALQLVAAHPGQVSGPVERFFDVPEVSEPGLVVVAAGDWQP